MFNLYFDVDVNRKVVTIEPRDDFFTGVSVDITDKIDKAAIQEEIEESNIRDYY